MRRVLRFAFLSVALIAAVMVLSAVLVPGEGGPSPYASSLSSLVAGDVYAAKPCANRGCNWSRKTQRYVCGYKFGYTDCHNIDTGCSARVC